MSADAYWTKAGMLARPSPIWAYLVAAAGALSVSSAHAQLVEPNQVPVGLPPEITGELPPDEEDEDDVLTIEELVDPLVLSASNRAESTLTAPAWVMTITREDIDARGYEELSDLLDDLPGMDVIRPYGDTYFRSYWRGYRNLIGAPYLLLVDGMNFNHLYLNEAEIMAAFPLSGVQRVEVVHGPASALYGPNAAMGVINVITRAGPSEEEGLKASTRFFLKAPTDADLNFSNMSKVADAFVKFQTGSLWASAAARFDVMVLDPSVSERFEYTSNRYYREPQFYGEFLNRPEIAGSFNSQNRKEALDVRLGYNDTEIGYQRYRMTTGTGLVYAADRASNRIPYVTFEESVFLRHQQNFSEIFSSTTLLRYRQSHIDPPTAWLEFSHAAQEVTFQYWQSTNFSYEAQQDFSISAFRGFLTGEDELVLDVGFRYERRDLERDYIRNGEYFWDPSLPFAATSTSGPNYTFPEPTDSERQIGNRDQVDTFGAYAMARLRLFQGHYFNLGIRIDYNSFFGDVSPIFRGGYVGEIIPDLTVKLLYGQAIREPNRRVLFGGFSATGSNLELERERSQTGEFSVAWQYEFLALQGNFWVVDVQNGLVSANGTPQNVGSRLMIGSDFSVVALFSVPPLRQLKLWAFYSPYYLAEEQALDSTTGQTSMKPIGDLAQHKVLLGMTLDVHRLFDMTLLSRCISSRDPVSTNPLGTIDAYCTVDTNLRFRDVLVDDLWASIRGTNLLGTAYFHPGVGSADSGDSPGSFSSGIWSGSEGYFNSRLPQPGRQLSIHIGLDY